MKKFTLFFLFIFLFSNFSFGQKLFSSGVLPVSPPTNPNVGIGLSNPTSDLHVDGADVLFENNNFRTGVGNSILGSTASGAFGQGNIVDGNSCFSLGAGNMINGTSLSIALGEDNNISGGHANISLGGHNVQNGDYTFSMGSHLQTFGDNTFTMGHQVINPIPFSFLVGFFNTPNLFIDGNSGKTGVNTMTPQEELHVNGVVRVSSLASTGNSRVCADADGNLIISGLCGGGDNLGDHRATKNLSMNCHEIDSVANINFCNGTSLDQSVSGALIMKGGAFGIGLNPLSTGISGYPGPYKFAVGGSVLAHSYYAYSDKRFKKDIKKLPNALENVMKLQGYNYKYHKNKYPEYDFQSDKTIGFIAQEIEKIYPELVKEKDGFRAVNYVGLIPVLTEAIKEQQEIIEEKVDKIEELENRLTKIETLLSSGINTPKEITSSTAVLKQNRPNPLSDKTTIEYDFPKDVTDASLIITDISGKTKMKFSLPQSSKSVTINTSDWNNGTYFYTLSVDGKTQDTKKMVIQK